MYEAQDDCGGFAGGIGSNFPFNHLWPLVAGGGGMSDFWKGYEPEPTRPAPVQEPVQASQIQSDVQEALFEATYLAGRPLAPLVAIEGNAGRYVIDALTPPAAQRQWVGLTDEERNKIRFDYLDYDERARAIEAKLKEKNNG